MFETNTIPEVSDESLRFCIKYLNENLEFPFEITGSEDFPWEEKYIFGFGSKDEWEEEKMNKPSYKDTYMALEVIPYYDRYGLYIKAKRTSRMKRKKFDLILGFITCTEKEGKNGNIIEAYKVWRANY